MDTRNEVGGMRFLRMAAILGLALLLVSAGAFAAGDIVAGVCKIDRATRKYFSGYLLLAMAGTGFAWMAGVEFPPIMEKTIKMGGIATILAVVCHVFLTN